MKLYINDPGNPSVGIFPAQFAIDCPFEREDVDQEDIDYFRKLIKEAYWGFCEGKIYTAYDFELINEQD